MELVRVDRQPRPPQARSPGPARLVDRGAAGPLAVTFVRGTIRKVADRFDAIMASTRLNVHHVEHNYEDAVSAGSDHSYVLATLELDR